MIGVFGQQQFGELAALGQIYLAAEPRIFRVHRKMRYREPAARDRMINEPRFQMIGDEIELLPIGAVFDRRLPDGEFAAFHLDPRADAELPPEQHGPRNDVVEFHSVFFVCRMEFLRESHRHRAVLDLEVEEPLPREIFAVVPVARLEPRDVAHAPAVGGGDATVHHDRLEGAVSDDIEFPYLHRRKPERSERSAQRQTTQQLASMHHYPRFSSERRPEFFSRIRHRGNIARFFGKTNPKGVFSLDNAPLSAVQ